MKKVTRILGAVCMMGLLTFVSTSCKKDKENGETNISVTIPGFETVGDRAYISPMGVFWWHENDFIRVYNLADEENAIFSKTAVYSKIGNQTAQTARFRGPYLGAKKAEGYRYFYPINMVDGTNAEIEMNLCDENRQTFVVADHQQFHSYEHADYHHYSMVDPEAMPMTTQVNKLSDNATLQHLFGVASFYLKAAVGTTVVVDSVKLVDHSFNIAGDVSFKLHKLCFDDSQGEEHNLNYVWNAFYDMYHGVTPEFVTNVLTPELEWLGWETDPSTTSKTITLDCIYEHEDGELKGVTLPTAENYTSFNFMLRPFALHEGFDLTVYVHGQEEPIVLTTDPHEDPYTHQIRGDFYYGATSTPNYTWAIRPGFRIFFTKSTPIN